MSKVVRHIEMLEGIYKDKMEEAMRHKDDNMVNLYAHKIAVLVEILSVAEEEAEK